RSWAEYVSQQLATNSATVRKRTGNVPWRVQGVAPGRGGGEGVPGGALRGCPPSRGGTDGPRGEVAVLRYVGSPIISGARTSSRRDPLRYSSPSAGELSNRYPTPGSVTRCRGR